VRFRPFDQGSEAGRASERHRRVVLTAGSAAAAKAVSLAVSLISVPLTIRYLGLEQYGLWLAISSAISVFSFADLGIGNGLVNALSEAYGRGDRDAARRFVSGGAYLLLSVGLVILALFAAAYPWIPWARVFNVKSAAAMREAGPTVAALVVCFAANIPAGVVQRVQIAYQEGFASNLWQCAGSALGLLALLIAIHFHAGLPWLVLAMSGAPVLAALANSIAVFGWTHPWLRPRWRCVTRQATARVRNMGFLFLAQQLAMAIAFYSDNIVTAQVLGADAVPQYSVPFKLFSIPAIMLSFVLAPLWPAYAESRSRGEIAWLSRTFFRSLKWATTFSILAAIALILSAKPIVRVWAGPEIHPPASLLLGLAAWTIMAGAGSAIANLLNGLHIVRLQVIVGFSMALVNLPLSILLCRAIGVAGAIWGTVISYGLLALLPELICVPRILRRLRNDPQAPPGSQADAGSVQSTT
jgi:O-antigen/teichoic acid export membrane protein